MHAILLVALALAALASEAAQPKEKPVINPPPTPKDW
ncbi:MAG: hypothetical protein JWO70_1031, partial [Betaproteobacteria bacterium]|nr:hypothetical protein [Betaproteobacteria bacterium]